MNSFATSYASSTGSPWHAAVRWHSDYQEALLLGEAVGISLLRDQRETYNEQFAGFTFTKFDGTTITV